ncbi:hypothetical protein ACHAXN_004175 [Cyclotella atomus]
MLAPRRMFLGELPTMLQKNPSTAYQTELRLMGRVTHVSRTFVDKATDDSSGCEFIEQEDVMILVIDDGTSSVDVVATSSQPYVEIGQLVDCIGHLQSVPDSQESKAVPNSKQQRNYYLEAKSISLVNNPQEETLRQLELSKRSAELDNAQNNNMLTTFQKISKNRVIASPHLEEKLNTLHHSTFPFPSITLDSDDALRYIKYSARHGGLAMNELETLVGATVNREKRAVREAVEKLQSCGMVYVKEGKLFPL